MRVNDTRVTGCNRRDALRLLGTAMGSALVTPWAGRLVHGQTAAAWLTARSATSARFPRGAIIRTVLADLPPERLGDGATMIHEHLTGNYSSPPPAPGAQRGAGGQPSTPQDVDLMVEEMRA